MTNEVRLLWTWCHSHVCTSSWRASHPWHLVARSNIVHWPSQNLVRIGPRAWRPWSRTYLPKVKISTLLVVAVDSTGAKEKYKGQGIQIRTKSQVGWPWMALFQVSLPWPSWANPNADQVVSQVRWSEQRGHVAEVDGEAIWPLMAIISYSLLPAVNSSSLFCPGSLSPSSSHPLQLAAPATSVPPKSPHSQRFSPILSSG